MFKVIPLYLAAFILFSACASTGPAARNDSASDREAAAQEAAAAAMDALAVLDGGSPRSSASSSRQNSAAPAGASQAAAGGRTSASTQTQTQRPAIAQAKPAWVDALNTVYPESSYIAVEGFGSDRNQAERDAVVKLTAYFGQSVQADLETISRYNEKVTGGAVDFSEETDVLDAIKISVEMDMIVGAQLADVWYDPQGFYHVTAIMEREKTSLLYATLIQSNDRFIDRLTNLPPNVKNSLDGYSRYLLAADVADVSVAYARVLTLIGNTRGIDPVSMKRGDDYRVEATELTKNIPIGVVISGDKGNRLRSAFAKAISGAGFRSGGTNSRYILRAEYSVTEAVFPNQPNIFVRYQINGGLEDTAEGDSVLVPFDASGREGHLTLANAEERALQTAEKKITAEFETALKKYLSTLLPE